MTRQTDARDADKKRSRAVRAAELSDGDPAASEGIGLASAADTLLVKEEVLNVGKRQVSAGAVRISTRTEQHQAFATVDLTRNVVDVTRVPVGRTVETAPEVRIEGELTIVPVVEERFVIVKQLFLVEELHIRRHVETTSEQVPVQLRRQSAVIERIAADGTIAPDPADR